VNPDDIVELPDGRRLMVISPERASEICKDVQLWFLTPSGYWRPEMLPTEFRRYNRTWGVGYFPLPMAIELDHDKEEYVCSDSPSPS
jgi:hypothetical protein